MSAQSLLFESFFAVRVSEGRPALFCRYEPDGARAAIPSAENLASFCFPQGVEAVKPSPYLVTCEFTFTLTGGNGGRLHGVCRKTHDPTHRAAKGDAKRFPQVLCILSQHCWQPFFSKVLEVADQLLAQHASCPRLTAEAPAARFLTSLTQLVAAAGPPHPPLGALLRVPLPITAAPISVDRMRQALVTPGQRDQLLDLSADAIEMEVPPDLGNSTANAGVSLARLLWFLTPRQAVTLVASLLLERRIILVARDADTVSAAVHAASALLYPFRWQHIYLPLLPLSLKDYLAAPMPYLVGIQADCLPLLRGMPMEEVLMIDLDTLGSCTPELGSPTDDYWALPFARELEDVFEVVRDHIKSPTEFDSTPKCTELLQDFFMRLVGRYRQFIKPDDLVTPAALALGLDRLSVSSVNGGASSKGNQEEDNPRAHWFLFDQAAFIAAHRRKDKVVGFLQQFRNSQMLEVFITERLKLASEGYITDDPFEQKVAHRNARLGVRIGAMALGGGSGGAAAAATGASKGRFSTLLRKAGSVVKQGSGSFVASIRQMGTSQQEEVHLAGRVPSAPSLSRISPSVHGLGLSRLSPMPTAAAVAHSRANSFGGSKPGSRSGSFSSLHRPSANLAALNGGVQPSLQQLRPDMFFGADEDEDGGSVASDISAEGAHPAPKRGSPGPLEKALGASRSLAALFHSSPPGPPPLPQHQCSSRLPPSQHHSASRLGTSESFEQLQQLGSGGSSAAAGSIPALHPLVTRSDTGSSGSKFGAASRGIALEASASKHTSAVAAAGGAAPLSALIDLASPPQQAAYWQQQPAQQGASAAAGHPIERNASFGTWAAFAEDVNGQSSFGSPIRRQGSSAAGVAAADNGLPLNAPCGPLGVAMSRDLQQMPSSSSMAGAAGGQQLAQPPQHQAAPPQQQYQQRQPPTPAQHLFAPQQQQQQQQSPLADWAAFAAWKPPPAIQVGLPPAAERQQQQQLQYPQQPVSQNLLEGMSLEGLRQAVHSPLQQGMPAVHRLGSMQRGGTSSSSEVTPRSGASIPSDGPALRDVGTTGEGRPRRRGSSGSSDGMQHAVTVPVTQDAFAGILLQGAAAASEQMPGRQHTDSPWEQQQQQSDVVRTTSWAEWAQAAPLGGDPEQQPAQQQQQHALVRQLTAGGRTVSFGDYQGWSGAWQA